MAKRLHWIGATTFPVAAEDWDALAAIPLEDIGLNNWSTLTRHQIYTVADLMLWSADDLVRECSNIGPGKLERINQGLHDIGLQLPTPDQLHAAQGSSWTSLREHEHGMELRRPNHAVSEMQVGLGPERPRIWSTSPTVNGLLTLLKVATIHDIQYLSAWTFESRLRGVMRIESQASFATWRHLELAEADYYAFVERHYKNALASFAALTGITQHAPRAFVGIS